MTPQELVDKGFAQTSRKMGYVSRVHPSHYGEGAWYHARVNPAESVRLTPEELKEFRALGGPSAGPGWDGRPPVKPEPIKEYIYVASPEETLEAKVERLQKELDALKEKLRQLAE